MGRKSRMNGREVEHILWRTDPTLGNDRETTNEVTPAARYQILNNLTIIMRNGVFCDVRANML